MSSTNSISLRHEVFVPLLFDGIAVAFVLFIPALSHLTSIPLYLFEPMRIIVILALLHTNKKNAYMLALVLPLFSFFISSHPVFLKSLLITIELLLNVWLFQLAVQYVKKQSLVIVFSILGSKVIYYLLKYLLLSFVLLDGTLISTPLYIQTCLILSFAGYSMLLVRFKKKRNLTE